MQFFHSETIDFQTGSTWHKLKNNLFYFFFYFIPLIFRRCTFIRYSTSAVDENGEAKNCERLCRSYSLLPIGSVMSLKTLIESIFFIDSINIFRAMEMSVRFGGSQPKMRNTTINELGTYQSQLLVGDIQSLTFYYGDDGHFYLSSFLSLVVWFWNATLTQCYTIQLAYSMCQSMYIVHLS